MTAYEKLRVKTLTTDLCGVILEMESIEDRASAVAYLTASLWQSMGPKDGKAVFERSLELTQEAEPCGAG